MSKRGWHLNALSGPAAVHIACTRLTLQVVETFISDLKACVAEAKEAPEGKGTMVVLEARAPSDQRSWKRWQASFWIRCTRRDITTRGVGARGGVGDLSDHLFTSYFSRWLFFARFTSWYYHDEPLLVATPLTGVVRCNLVLLYIC
ncbi:hypothetical protein OG21DRAFT_950136 [Imleria badia]|nr:hypothetical protein OG21DRAFT_950136 [Imleria badia]